MILYKKGASNVFDCITGFLNFKKDIIKVTADFGKESAGYQYKTVDFGKESAGYQYKTSNLGKESAGYQYKTVDLGKESAGYQYKTVDLGKARTLCLRTK